MTHSISRTLTLSLLALVALTSCKDEDEKWMATGLDNGHEYVDLGLSVKWATTNIGANAAQQYGDHFSWGETSPKNNYDVDTYKYMDAAQKPSKYTDANSFQLELEDDAAHVQWGGDWRIPSETEWNELRNTCEWTWTMFNEQNGFKVKAPNGNWIFLPVTGYMSGSTLKTDKSYGFYWTSDMTPDAPENAICLNLFNRSFKLISQNRVYGFGIRAVR